MPGEIDFSWGRADDECHGTLVMSRATNGPENGRSLGIVAFGEDCVVLLLCQALDGLGRAGGKLGLNHVLPEVITGLSLPATPLALAKYLRHVEYRANLERRGATVHSRMLRHQLDRVIQIASFK